MGISVNPVSVNPQVIGGNTAPPDPWSVVLNAIMQGTELGFKGQDADQRKQEFELRKKLLDLELAGKKQTQLDQKMQGEALKQLLPYLIETGQLSPGAMGGPQQQAQQPVLQPQGLPPVAMTPSAPSVPLRGSQGPMQRFNELAAGLPASAVPGFLAQFGPLAEKAQAEKDQSDAFDEANRLTAGLLTPEQDTQFSVAKLLFQAGMPKEVWQSMLPKEQIELAKSGEEIRGIKNKKEADRVATGKLVGLGLLPPSQGGAGVEYVVDGASKMFYDYIADVRKDARQAAREAAKVNQAEVVKGLEGAALEIAALNPDWTGSKIKQALKTNPQYASLADGVVAKAALEAPEAARRLNAPRNESEARARVTYGPGRAALMTVNAMDAKGVSLGALSRLAQTGSKEAAMATAAAGAAIGTGIMGPGVGTAVGGGIGGGVGLVAAPLVRGGARMAMSEDQQRMQSAALSLIATVLRPESGAAITDEEARQAIERYIPLSTDDPATKELKRVLRNQLDETLANVSGLPRELGDQVVNSLLAKHEQQAIEGFIKPGQGGAPSPEMLRRIQELDKKLRTSGQPLLMGGPSGARSLTPLR